MPHNKVISKESYQNLIGHSNLINHHLHQNLRLSARQIGYEIKRKSITIYFSKKKRGGGGSKKYISMPSTIFGSSLCH